MKKFQNDWNCDFLKLNVSSKHKTIAISVQMHLRPFSWYTSCFYQPKDNSLWINFRNKNELAVPDAASVAPSEEPEVDFRKKIKYGNRIQVRQTRFDQFNCSCSWSCILNRLLGRFYPSSFQTAPFMVSDTFLRIDDTGLKGSCENIFFFFNKIVLFLIYSVIMFNLISGC